MTVQPDIPHKVSHIRHDLDDLYELVSRVEKSQALVVGVLEQHDNRFEELQLLRGLPACCVTSPEPGD